MLILSLMLIATSIGAKAQVVHSSSEHKLCADAVANGQSLSASEIEAMTADLKKDIAPKGEFETTADYNKRAAGAMEKYRQRLSDKYKTPYVVIIGKVGLWQHKVKYNADAGQLIFDFEWGVMQQTTPFFNDSHWVVVTVKNEDREISSYQATNAFGVTMNVSVRESHVTGVAVARGDRWPVPSLKQHIVNAPPDEAKSLKENARVVLVADLKPPFFERYERDTSLMSPPTVRSPYVTTEVLRVLVAEPLCVALFDQATGKILKVLLPPEAVGAAADRPKATPPGQKSPAKKSPLPLAR